MAPDKESSERYKRGLIEVHIALFVGALSDLVQIRSLRHVGVELFHTLLAGAASFRFPDAFHSKLLSRICLKFDSV